jgi:hypothetical protein
MRSISRKLRLTLFVFVAFASVSATWAQEKSRTAESIWGSRYRASQQVRVQQRESFRRGSRSLRRLLRWNAIAIDASGRRQPLSISCLRMISTTYRAAVLNRTA